MDTQKPSPSNENPIQKQGKPDAGRQLPPERGGFADKNLPEPTRYNDWEVGGRCSDF